MFSTLLPIFIGEVASPLARDRLLYFAHATLSCGYAVSYGFVDIEAEDLSSYNLYCALACLPAILCCLSMCFNPVKSMVYGEEDAARNASLFYNSNMNAAQLDKRMQELREMMRIEKTLKVGIYVIIYRFSFAREDLHLFEVHRVIINRGDWL